MTRAALIALAIAGGCGFIAKHQVKSYEHRVEVYEQLAPDGEALGRGDTRTTEDMLRKMEEWAGYIEQQDLPPVDRQRLVDRLHVAEHRYLLAAAPLADTPDLGYALARAGLTTDNPEALALVRRLADARGARRQELLATNHSYFIDTGDDLMLATVAGGMSVENGQVEQQWESKRLVERPGNCVFATRGFGAEGARNPGLTFRIVGDRAVVHVRCYLRRDPQGLPADEGEVIVVMADPFGSYAVKTVPPKRVSDRYRDYVLTRRPTGSTDGRFSHVEMSLTYEYTADLVAVWEEGRQRVRKLRKTIVLAGSPLFWDGDGALAAAAVTEAQTAGARSRRPAAPAASADSRAPARSRRSAR